VTEQAHQDGDHPQPDQAPRARYQDLERRKGALLDQVKAIENKNHRREVRLAHVENAVIKDRRHRTTMMWTFLLFVAGAVGGFYIWFETDDATPEIPVDVTYRTHAPRLMVTSAPSPALVIVNGKTAGKTPLVRPLPPAGTSYTVEVRAAGYDNWKKTFEAREGAGRHVHAVFVPPTSE